MDQRASHRRYYPCIYTVLLIGIHTTGTTVAATLNMDGEPQDPSVRAYGMTMTILVLPAHTYEGAMIRTTRCVSRVVTSQTVMLADSYRIEELPQVQ